MNAALRESLYDLYELGGLELMAQGTRGQRNLTGGINDAGKAVVGAGTL